MSDTGRNKTVVTVVSKISDRPASKEACLVVIYGMDLGKKYNVDRPSLIIGRSSKAGIRSIRVGVAQPLQIINTGKTILCATCLINGTYVNDELVDEYVLRDGDFIKIGRCIFKFLSGNNIENAYHEEIYRLTTIDGLTQIYNKRYCRDLTARSAGPRCARAVAGDARPRSLQAINGLRPPRQRLRAQAPGHGDQVARRARTSGALRRRRVRHHPPRIVIARAVQRPDPASSAPRSSSRTPTSRSRCQWASPASPPDTGRGASSRRPTTASAAKAAGRNQVVGWWRTPWRRRQAAARLLSSRSWSAISEPAVGAAGNLGLLREAGRPRSRADRRPVPRRRHDCASRCC
jgi:hypothetical protein